MKCNFSYLLFFALLSCLPVVSHAQLTVSPGQPAATLAAKLAGNGINITSPVLTCSGAANATFTSVTTPIIIDSGVILTSGRAINTTGLESFLASTNNGTPGDPDLATLAGTTTFDACILEFDFVPKGDTVSFNYQFGSEEYSNSTCGQYNDAFAFFISGPGIVGLDNMALVPGTNIPVTVNSINSGIPGPPGWPGFCDIANCTAMGPGSPFITYFVNNAGGTQVTYRGYTQKLKAFHAVTPCVTYHLKMTVADAANSLYDSGVFIEAGSLSTNTYKFKRTDSIGHTIGGVANAFVKGCAPATLTVLNSRATGTPQTVFFTYGGTAVTGTDFTGPASAIIPPGDTSVTISISGIPTTPGGIKTLFVYLSSPFSCGTVDTVALNILDAPTANIITNDTAICFGASITINATGTPGLLYSWSPASSLSGSTTMTPIASPTVATTYTMSATYPLSGCAPIIDTINVAVNTAPMNIITPDTTICKGDEVKIQVSGVVGLSYSWSPASSLDNATTQNPIARPTATTTYSVSAISTIGGCPAFDQITITVANPTINVTNSAPYICYEQPVQLMVAGDPAYSYSWEPGIGLDNPLSMQPFASPSVTTTYTVTAIVPGLLCKVSDIAVVTVHPRVIAEASSRRTVCINEPIELFAEPRGMNYSYDWTGPDAFTSILQNPYVRTARAESKGIYTVVVTDNNTGCTGTDTAFVNVGNASSVLTNVTADQIIKLGSSIQLDARNCVLYTWLPNDGSLNNNNINNPIATPIIRTEYVVIAVDSNGCKNIDTVVIDVTTDNEVFIPSGFTPNGDGLNDVFRLPPNSYHKMIEMSIFNRWGEMVFHNTSGDKTGWDGMVNGQPASMGVYFYTFAVSNPNGEVKILKGDVTLIR